MLWSQAVPIDEIPAVRQLLDVVGALVHSMREEVNTARLLPGDWRRLGAACSHLEAFFALANGGDPETAIVILHPETGEALLRRCGGDLEAVQRFSRESIAMSLRLGMQPADFGIGVSTTEGLE